MLKDVGCYISAALAHFRDVLYERGGEAALTVAAHDIRASYRFPGFKSSSRNHVSGPKGEVPFGNPRSSSTRTVNSLCVSFGRTARYHADRLAVCCGTSSTPGAMKIAFSVFATAPGMREA